MIYFKRNLSQIIIDFIEEKEKHKDVLILAGARQVGKTTLLTQILENRPHLFLNLEKKRSIARQIDACEDFEDFSDYLADEHKFRPQEKILVIDEAQVSQKLSRFVRFMKEDWNFATVILTGSTVSELTHDQERESVGRETYLELWPLTFKEFLQAWEKDSLVKALENFQWGDDFSASKHERFIEAFEQYLHVGGLPEVAQKFFQNKDYKKYRRDILASYEDDFVRYFSLDEINLFQRCLQAVASNVGSPSKDTHVVRLDAPAYKKVANIFARLERWRLILKNEQYGVEPEKNKFFPKRYLFDIGILGDLRFRGMETISLSDLTQNHLRTPLGGWIENAIALSLRVQFEKQVFGLKLGLQTEIDFAVKTDDVVYPIECKAALNFKGNYLKALHLYLQNYTTRAKGFLFYGGRPLQREIKGVHVLPYYLCDELRRLILRE